MKYFQYVLFACLVLLASASGIYAEGGNTASQFKNDATSEEMAEINKQSTYLVSISSFDPKTGLSTGTGFLHKDRRGRWGIYTNNHVLGPASINEVWVRFQGVPQAYKVLVLSRDPALDLALLDVPTPLPSSVTSIDIGDTRTLAIGDKVFAIGFPFNVRSIVVGYVNSLSAPNFGKSALPHAFFTSQAPVLPGNSGGPLLRIRADGTQEVIGVNTSISRVGLMSFSIHASYLKRAIPRLWRESVVSHASAGLCVLKDADSINPIIYEAITGKTYPPQESGVMVAAVKEGLPARNVGIQAGDFITKLEYLGREISFSKARDVMDRIFFDFRAGSKVTVSIRRNGQDFVREVTLEEYAPC